MTDRADSDSGDLSWLGLCDAAMTPRDEARATHTTSKIGGAPVRISAIRRAKS